MVPIELQPLRDRRNDILPLAEHFLRLSSDQSIVLSPDAAQRLKDYSWPGNVRELRNSIERAVIFARGDTLTFEDFDFLGPSSEQQPSAADGSADLPTALAELERRMIANALAQCRGNRTEAARHLGIHRQLLHTKVMRYGLSNLGKTR